MKTNKAENPNVYEIKGTKRNNSVQKQSLDQSKGAFMTSFENYYKKPEYLVVVLARMRFASLKDSQFREELGLLELYVMSFCTSWIPLHDQT